MADDGAESTLVRQAAEGDQESFTALFRRYYPMIYAFACRICLDPAEAQEIVQETFIKAARSIATIRDAATFKGWLYRIARNVAVDLNRASARRANVADAAGRHEHSRREERPVDYSPVTEALAALPHDLRETIALTFYEGLSHAEAARVLDCAETTVSWRLFMAKRKLKYLLRKQNNG